MYNNSNGTVEHGDGKPTEKETETTPVELTGDKNMANPVGKPAESECKDIIIEEEEVAEEGEEEEVEESNVAEPTDSSAVAPNVTVSVEEAQHAKEGEEDDGDDARGEKTVLGAEMASDDALMEDVSEAKMTEEYLEEPITIKGETAEEDAKANEGKAEEMPGQSAKEKVKVDLDICRVCMEASELSDIFQLEGPMRVSDIIMKLCTNIRITARDHLPHKICERCLGHVRIVNEFKLRCEASDKELRKTLSRSTSKSRRQVIVVNCPMSDSENDDEPIDDDEYQVSQSEVESEPNTSDDSFSPPNKRKRTPKKRGRKPSPRSASSGRRGRVGRRPKHTSIATPIILPPIVKRGPGRPPKNPKPDSLSNIVYIEAPEDSSSSDDGSSEQKRHRRKRGDHPCPKCSEVLPSLVALKSHLKLHPADVFNCDRCTLWFKTKQALINHVQRHEKADRVRDAKRREREQRQEKRFRDSVDTEEKKPVSQYGSSTEKKKKLDPAPASSGRDLFKCVAPLTSTYWSDSFSD